MKTKITNLMSCFLLLSVLVACGKKDEGGSSNNGSANTFIAPNGSLAGQQAYDNLKNWYNAADNTAVGSHGAYTEKTGSANFSFTKQLCGPGILNFLCEKPTKCYRRTSAGVINGTVIMGGSQGLRYDGCDVSVINLYNKSTDQDLKDAVLGKAGRFLIPSMTRQSGSIFTVYFAAYEGSTTPVAAYQVNTSLPAVLNPILKQEGEGFNITETKTIYLLLQ